MIRKHIEIISKVFNDNPYSKYFNELTKSKPLSEYYVYFTGNICQYQRRYNKHSTGECAVLIVFKDGDILNEYDLCVYPKEVTELLCSVEFNV